MTVQPIEEIAHSIDIPDEHLLRYGHDKAKVDLNYLTDLPDRKESHLVLMTAITPTPAGEGKTTTSIGLADGLRRIGKNAMVALREPSMGPVFGVKGGATGGGKASILPIDEINLHFTGDFAAIAEAQNLLAAMTDAALYFRTVELDPATVSVRRAIDMNDRVLRDIVIGVGAKSNGVTRETGFDITAASEVMATFCMATSLEDLKERLGRIVIGEDYSGNPVTAHDIHAEGAMTAVLRDALAPNLVQSMEGTPAFLHGGPFANIAHGCNSVIATKSALKLADYVITEAGFGADLGAEKFMDIVCRKTGLRPDVSVIVATVRALKYHGGVAVKDLGNGENVEAVKAGLPNLVRHVENLQKVFGQHVVVAINQFASDTEAEIQAVRDAVAHLNVDVVLATHFADGGAGAEDLAKAVVKACEESPSQSTFAYEDGDSLTEKATKIARQVYHAGSVSFTPAAKKMIAKLEQWGWADAPVCMAKTQSSFTTDPKAVGAPEGFDVQIREVRLSAGAGFVVMLTGSIMTLPGLGRRPSAVDVDVTEDGEIVGMH
ncbi:MAG: formate--tetrahydrofolate ligase [Actinomycetaceae bacterium]|nr:formate--tetrahydrofolate ligase [Actinomycetaceae bacterium]MDY6083525.1 formate--tetrahydrofolate ligase [Actinomycetaceae bacterium]